MERTDNKKINMRVLGKYLNVIVLIFFLIVIFVATFTYILQKGYTENALEFEVDRDRACSDAVHKLIGDELDREHFSEIKDKSDMDTQEYQKIQARLNEIRHLNAIRYFYTAARNDEGKLVYLVDGLDMGAEDFRNPGDYIEDEMIPYIERALSGETVYSIDIVDTTWGHIFTACYPVVANDDPDEVIGALCIEMDMESAYALIEKSNHTSLVVGIIAAVMLVLLSFGIFMTLRKQQLKEKQQKIALAEAADAADAANRAKSTFLFNMSHDIRTPMNAIIGYAELADDHLDEPDVLKEYMNKIHTCSQKMLSILDNILELARIENNTTILEEAPVKTETGIDFAVDMFYSAADKKNQELTVDRNITYPYIYIDSSRVSEIILNLVSNAIKYTGNNGHIHCELNQYPHKDEGWCYTEFSVEDDGIGMSEEFQSHIFDYFSRERTSTVSGIEGSGLGMGIVKKLVDLMDGTIEIKSRQGKGSKFTITIPCRIASEEECQPKEAQTHQVDSDLSGKRILLVEDNDLNAEIAMELLEREELIVDRAENGVDCLEKYEKSEYGYYKLILMDIQMPVMDGYDTTIKIRHLDDKEKSTIPIIAMTANAFAEDRQKAISVGMDDYVAKPIDMNKLIPILQKNIK